MRLKLGGPHGCYQSRARLFVLDEMSEDVILGKDWLEFEDPYVRWRENALVFKADHKVAGLSEEQAECVCYWSAVVLGRQR